MTKGWKHGGAGARDLLLLPQSFGTDYVSLVGQ